MTHCTWNTLCCIALCITLCFSQFPALQCCLFYRRVFAFVFCSFYDFLDRLAMMTGKMWRRRDFLIKICTLIGKARTDFTRKILYFAHMYEVIMDSYKVRLDCCGMVVWNIMGMVCCCMKMEW